MRLRLKAAAAILGIGLVVNVQQAGCTTNAGVQESGATPFDAKSPAQVSPAPVLISQAAPAPAGTPAVAPAPNSTTPITAPRPGTTPPMIAAQIPPKPAPVTVSGFMDFYIQHSFESQSPGSSLKGRIYSTRVDVPALALVWLDVTHAAPPGGWGAKVSLAVGDSADSDHAGIDHVPGYGGGSRYKNIQQAFVNYAAKNGLMARFGKYLSPYGYDTTETYLNPLYSVTLDTFLAPNYVEGLDVSYPIAHSNVVLEAFLVNSLHEEQNIKSPDGILRLHLTALNGKLSYLPALGFGTDSVGGSNEQTVKFDNWLTYNATNTLTLAGEYIYNRESGGANNSKSDGYGLYLRQQLTPRTAAAFRHSSIEKHPDAVPSGIYRAYEFTAMYEYKLAAPLTARLELRHDHSSNAGVFPFGTAANPRADQNTLTLAALYNF